MTKKDWTNWEIEKSQSIVKYLTEVVESLKKGVNLEEIHCSLNYAIYDALKIWSHSSGSLEKFNDNDSDLLLNKGMAGFEKLKVKYGLIKETQKQSKYRELIETLNKIREYSKGPQSPNRTFIHECLEVYDYNDKWIKIIEDETMRVSNGNLSWGKYQETITPILNDWEVFLKIKHGESLVVKLGN